MKFSFDQYDRMTTWLSLCIHHTMGKTVCIFKIQTNCLKCTFTTPVTCFWSDAEMNPRNLTSVKKGQTFIGHLIYFTIFLLLLVILRSFDQLTIVLSKCLEYFYYFVLIYIFICSTYSFKPRVLFITHFVLTCKIQLNRVYHIRWNNENNYRKIPKNVTSYV